MAMEGLPLNLVNPTDQIRKLLTPGNPSQMLPAGSTETIGPTATGNLMPAGGGYEMVAGLVESDQPFHVHIRQGATWANQQTIQTLTAALDPVSGFWRLLVRWPVASEYIRIDVTNDGILQTAYRRTFYLMPIGQGWMAGFYPEAPAIVRITDLLHFLAIQHDGGIIEDTGIGAFGGYLATPTQIPDGTSGLALMDRWRRFVNPSWSEVLGADQIVDKNPVPYDLLTGTVRVAAALPAAGAEDVPLEIVTQRRNILRIWPTYTRGAVGGAYSIRIQVMTTVNSTDTWGDLAAVRSGVFAPGADVQHDLQRGGRFQYTSTSAAAETVAPIFDIGRALKFRIYSRETGVVGTPGNLGIVYQLSNH